MKKVLLLGALLAFSLSVYAQRGGHGGGPPSGVGMGRPSTPGNSSSHSGDHNQNPNNNGGQKTPEDLLNHNTKLTANLQKLLPSTTTPQQACQGFRNLGRCVAAIHVAHNLRITFDDLKAKMLGGESLGSAIHDLKPDADAKQEAKKGEKQAKQDMDDKSS